MWLLSAILTEPPRPDKGQTFEDSRRFRGGLTLSKRRCRVVVPVPLAMVAVAIALFGVVADAVINSSTTDWAIKVADFCLRFNVFCHCATCYFLKEDIDKLSGSVDHWWCHRLLKEEGERLKQQCQRWMDSFNRYFHNFMSFTCISFILLPLTKLLANKETSELFIFKMWSPLPPDRWWAVLTLYLFQIFVNVVIFLSYGGLASYVMSVSATIGHQLRLVGLSCTTVHDRAVVLADQSQEGTRDPTRWYRIYSNEVRHEIASTTAHYQYLYRNAKEMCRIFTGLVDLVYYSGMSIVIMFGLKIATEKENKVVFVHAFLFINLVVANQYLFTIINDSISEEVSSLQTDVYNCPWYKLPLKSQKSIHLFQTMVRQKMPTLSNIMGIHVDREFFLRVINATYCYISTLMSMDL